MSVNPASQNNFAGTQQARSQEEAEKIRAGCKEIIELTKKVMQDGPIPNLTLAEDRVTLTSDSRKTREYLDTLKDQ
jgi:hypothetical protein